MLTPNEARKMEVEIADEHRELAKFVDKIPHACANLLILINTSANGALKYHTD
jgi:hypothetical protein